MELVCLGLNHETAPVEVREHFAVGADALLRSPSWVVFQKAL